MREAGYRTGQYRLVLQTYPVVIPRAADARYPETGPERGVYGCPFYDADMDWAQDVAAPRIGGAVRAAAAARGVPVLELLRAFTGHEVCARTAAAAGPGARRADHVGMGPRGQREHDRAGPDAGGLPPRRLRADGARRLRHRAVRRATRLLRVHGRAGNRPGRHGAHARQPVASPAAG